PVLLYPSATGATILRVSGQYIFNWDTSGFPNGCYNIVLKLSNGTTPTTIVGLN
ncbi:MAG: hypothetical protein HYR60_06520, partial [Acidobacteria bacterium]|nr:hypothetical protein [Acidobacteriota bacterium]